MLGFRLLHSLNSTLSDASSSKLKFTNQEIPDDNEAMQWGTLFLDVVASLAPMYVCMLGGSKKTKVKKLEGALSNPIPLVKRSSEQFLFLRLHVWKALPSIFPTSMGISMGK